MKKFVALVIFAASIVWWSIWAPAVAARVHAYPVVEYTYAWIHMPYLGSKSDDELQEKVLDWYVKKYKEGWESVGLPPCNYSLLMRKKLKG